MDVVRHYEEDTVAVALRHLEGGSEARGHTLMGGGDVVCTLRDEVPAGHKIALRDMEAGESVFRFGVDIGVATAPIRRGDHVHTHNCNTRRW